MKSFRLQRHGKRFWVIAGVVVVLVVAAGTVGVLSLMRQDEPSVTQSEATVPQSPEPPKAPTIRMVAMGDMLAHDTINSNAKTETGYDYGQYFTDIKKAYEGADLVFCNQEGLSSGETYGISGYPAFNAPIEFAQGLSNGAGCNVINLANNHMGDRGANAIATTLDVWDDLRPRLISGANRSPEEQNKNVSYATVNDIKVAFVSFADFNNNRSVPFYSVNLYHDEALVQELVTEARRNADVVIVSMHWGTEDSHTVNADQKAQAQKLAQLGVDVVIGTGPHVLQEVQEITRPDGGTMVVWYSLGNMLSSQLNVDQLVSGIAEFDITKTDTGITVDNLGFIPTYMHYEWTPAQKAANNLNARQSVHLYLLNDRTNPMARSLLGTTPAAQREAVAGYIGPLAPLKERY